MLHVNCDITEANRYPAGGDAGRLLLGDLEFVVRHALKLAVLAPLPRVIRGLLIRAPHLTGCRIKAEWVR